MTDPTAVETRLLAIVDTWSFPIGQDCRQKLVDLIHNASTTAPVWASDPVKIVEAETNLKKLLTEMTSQAGKMNLIELRETTFFGALKKLCPLFPFC